MKPFFSLAASVSDGVCDGVGVGVGVAVVVGVISANGVSTEEASSSVVPLLGSTTGSASGHVGRGASSFTPKRLHCGGFNAASAALIDL